MKTFIRYCFIGVFIFYFVVAAGIQSAHATAALMLDDGTTTKTIVDGSTAIGLIDLDPRTGIVSWYGQIGVFDLEIITGTTKPYLAGLPELDLFNLSANSSGSGTVDVWFSETGFGGVGSSATVQTTVGGTTDDQVKFYSYIDYSDTLFGQGTQTANLGAYIDVNEPTFDPPLGFSETANINVPVSSSFSITALAQVTHESAGELSSFDMNVKIAPEPISSTLFIIGAATLGFRRFRKTI